MEQVPDVWFRNKPEAIWNENIKAVAEFLGSKTSNLVFVPNTTTGESPEKPLLLATLIFSITEIAIASG